MIFNPSPYLGVPWVWRGRSPEPGWDCYGLLRWCVREASGIDLPDWLDRTDGVDPDDRSARHDLQDACLSEGRASWTKLARPEAGAGVLLFVHGRPVHCGFCLGNGQFLHVDRKMPTAIDRLDSLRWRDRIEGFYRAGRI